MYTSCNAHFRSLEMDSGLLRYGSFKLVFFSHLLAKIIMFEDCILGKVTISSAQNVPDNTSFGLQII